MTDHAPTVVIAGSLDTKGAEFAYLKQRIEQHGARTLVVDIGVMGPPGFEPDVTRNQVLAEAGANVERLTSGRHRDEAMVAMAAGLTSVVRRLHREGRLDGIIGMGGSSGTSITTAAMRALPVGVPKLMVSTMGGGDVSAFAGPRDIAFMPSVVDVAGLNRISRRIFGNAAAAIAGMVLADAPEEAQGRPVIAASMFGNTTPAVDRARGILEAAGYEVVVFHAVGSGGRAMESLIGDGLVAASLDITTTELADEVGGGILSAGPDRCLAAARAGIPTVLAPGCIDMINLAPDTAPDRYAGRTVYRWNPGTLLMRTTPDECRRIGGLLAAAANAARGPVTVLLPLGGLSMLDARGGEFWDPAADAACFDAIRGALQPHVRLQEVNAHINDPAFADLAAAELLRMLESSSRSNEPSPHPADNGVR